MPSVPNVQITKRNVVMEPANHHLLASRLVPKMPIVPNVRTIALAASIPNVSAILAHPTVVKTVTAVSYTRMYEC